MRSVVLILTFYVPFSLCAVASDVAAQMHRPWARLPWTNQSLDAIIISKRADNSTSSCDDKYMPACIHCGGDGGGNKCKGVGPSKCQPPAADRVVSVWGEPREEGLYMLDSA